MAISMRLMPELEKLHIEVVEIAHVEVQPPSAMLRLWADAVAERAIADSQSPEAEKLRTRVRQMLKHGKFKASGRSKPAQEYLLRCALEEGCLPRINGPVDVLNTVSLVTGLPISLLSIGKCSRNLEVRRGLAGEGYVFNAMGQLLDVEDLVVTCDATQSPSRPVGSPIKDSMAGKIESSDTELVAVIYAPNDTQGISTARLAAEMFGEAMVQHCQASLG